MARRISLKRPLAILAAIASMLLLVTQAEGKVGGRHRVATHRQIHHGRRPVRPVHLRPRRHRHRPGLHSKPRRHSRRRHHHAGRLKNRPATTRSTAGKTTGQQTGKTVTSAAGAGGGGLAGAHFYVYPWDSAVQEYNTLVSEGDGGDAARIAPVASQPEGVWLTSDSSSSMVPGIVSAASSSGTVPVFVVYNIPWRDCSQYSAGGASGASDYESFINTISSDLGQARAVVIVEPDALSELSCLSSSQQQTYYQLIGYAAQHLDADQNASVYVDAGNPGWVPAATEAAELNQALGSARGGFAVNVSNFAPTATDIAYGQAISQGANGRHFVVDTSRNGGQAAGGQWCNPPGAGIGQDPTTSTGNPLVDAFLWIKDVGESDGTCNGGPPAGQFWLSYALALVANG